jgi:hypothetical protein
MGRTRVAEVGSPLFVDAKVDWVEAEYRARRSREVWAIIPRRLLAAVVVGFVAGFGGWALVAGAIAAVPDGAGTTRTAGGATAVFFTVWVVVAVLVVRAGVRRGLAGSKGLLLQCRARRRRNAEMVAALRTGLGAEWTIMWDRRVAGWAAPVALAVGPPGVWGLASGTGTGTGSGAAQRLEDCLGTVLPGWTVHVVVPPAGGADAWRRVVTELARRPSVILSAGDRRSVVHYLETVTTPELAGAPAVWPRRTPALAPVLRGPPGAIGP